MTSAKTRKADRRTCKQIHGRADAHQRWQRKSTCRPIAPPHAHLMTQFHHHVPCRVLFSGQAPNKKKSAMCNPGGNLSVKCGGNLPFLGISLTKMQPAVCSSGGKLPPTRAHPLPLSGNIQTLFPEKSKTLQTTNNMTWAPHRLWCKL